MSRDDLHLDAMLRHLGAAYCDSLHGRAVQADVTRAVEEVADRIGESPDQQAAGRHHADTPRQPPAPRPLPQPRQGRYDNIGDIGRPHHWI
jgi:hypothetical protein